MPSPIWTPLEEVISKLFRFGVVAITAHTRHGKVHKLEVDLGNSKLAWTLEEVEQGRVSLRLLE